MYMYEFLLYVLFLFFCIRIVDFVYCSHKLVFYLDCINKQKTNREIYMEFLTTLLFVLPQLIFINAT
jgi:Iap family predicted aminopeptidase